jgi:DNA-directed RNA polymerase alpha subunit
MGTQRTQREEKVTRDRDWFAEPLETLGLSPRGLRRAQKAGATTVGELCLLTDDDLRATSGGIAEESRREIREKLLAVGLRLNDPKLGPCITRKGSEDDSNTTAGGDR